MDADETEFMENVFDSLCSALSEPQIKDLFLASEGVDLMVLMMKYVSGTKFEHSYFDTCLGKSCNLGRAPLRLWTMQCRARLEQLAVRHSSKHWV